MDENTMEYDALVVGGGPAGLSGAVTLSRSRRRVLLVDAGKPRNAPADGIHNLLTSEGMSPRDYATAGRAEARSYGAEIRDGRVESAAVVPGGFEARLADGSTVTARRLLVTTGLVDELPDVPGLRELWGRDVLHCPYCHGWEVRDRSIGVLASSDLAMHQVGLFRQLSHEVTLLLNDAFEPDRETRERLRARDVRVVRGRVAGLETSQGRLAGVHLDDGTTVPVDVLTVQPKFVARSEVLSSLGVGTAPMEMAGRVVAEHVPTDPTGLTSLAGVWAAGNVAQPQAQVGASAAGGVMAAAMLNADLVEEDVERAVQNRRLVS